MAAECGVSPDAFPDGWIDDHNPRKRVSETSDGSYMLWHCVESWDLRTPADSVAPETAWERGVDIPELLTGAEFFADRHGNTPDRVRTFAEDTTSYSYQVFLLENDGEIFTVMPFDWIREDDLWLRAAMMVLRNEVIDGE